MSQCKIQYQGARRRQTVSMFLGFLQDYVIPYLNITPFFTSRWRDLVVCTTFSFFYVFFFSSAKLQRMCSLSVRARRHLPSGTHLTTWTTHLATLRNAGTHLTTRSRGDGAEAEALQLDHQPSPVTHCALVCPHCWSP